MNKLDPERIPTFIAIYVLISVIIADLTRIYNIVPYSFMLFFMIISYLIKFDLIMKPENLQGKFGIANIITISRELIFISLVIAVESIYNLIFTMLVTFVLISDMVDGEVARARNEESKIGGMLDIEADASYNLLLTYSLIEFSLLPDWMIVVGVMRYIYILILNFVPLPKKTERRSKLAIAISICYNVALAFLWSLPYDWFQITTIGLGIFIILSFIRDFLYRIDLLTI